MTSNIPVTPYFTPKSFGKLEIDFNKTPINITSKGKSPEIKNESFTPTKSSWGSSPGSLFDNDMKKALNSHTSFTSFTFFNEPTRKRAKSVTSVKSDYGSDIYNAIITEQKSQSDFKSNKKSSPVKSDYGEDIFKAIQKEKSQRDFKSKKSI